MAIKLPETGEADIDMAPMIDMVFLLLIFFMVASVVSELDKAKVDIPTSRYGKVPENTEGRVILSVDKDGKLYEGVKEIKKSEMKERLKTALENNANTRVVLRSDADVQWKSNKEILLACADVGAVDIIYATFED